VACDPSTLPACHFCSGLVIAVCRAGRLSELRAAKVRLSPSTAAYVQ
jgi:hypothetical protein